MTDRTITIPPVRVTRTRTVLALIVLMAIVGAYVAGCSNKATQFWNDAPRTGVVNQQPADIISMPDGFNNVATKCDHGNRIYVSFHGNSGYGFGFAVPHDPTCAASTAAATRAHTTALVSSRRCSQSIRTTHNATTTTVTIIIRYCNRSYRAWARFADGKNIKGPWRTSGQSIVFNNAGGNQSGGFQYERTGGGTIYTHTSY